MIFLNLESYRKIQNIQTSMQIPYKYRRVRDLPSLSQNFVLFNGTFPRSTTPTEKICQQIKGKFCPASVMRIDYGLIKNSQRKNTEIDTGKKEYEIFRIDKAIESLKKKKLKPVLESEDQINRETSQNLAPSSQSLIREKSKQSMFQFARKKRNYKALPCKNLHLSRHAHYSTHKKSLNAEECGRSSTSSDDNRYLSPRYKEGS